VFKDNEELTTINHIIENEEIRAVYQPIFSIESGDVLAYEALTRGPKDTAYESPIELIELAERNGKDLDLEFLMRRKSIENAKQIEDKLLFINIDPNIVNHKDFESGITQSILAEHQLNPQQIVMEITERKAIEDMEGFQKTLNHYLDEGFQVAVDDFGSGFSGMQYIRDFRPHFIKIDISLIRNINKDAFNQSMVKSMISLANMTNMNVIAEGVENREEFETLVSLGVKYAQGYYFSFPVEDVSFIDFKSIKERINKYWQHHRLYTVNGQKKYNIASLLQETLVVPPDMICKKVKEILSYRRQKCVCVIDKDGKPLGLAMESEINRYLAQFYGQALYSQREIRLIMKKDFIQVEYFTPIIEVANMVVNRPSDLLYDNIVITRNGKYNGIVQVKDLLKFMIEFEKNYAKALNPLTTLPGNIIINQILEEAVGMDAEAGFLYFDLNDFKVYNDVYGFKAGDNIIRLTADVLQEVVEKYIPHESFVGHIGGDDFVVLVTCDIVTIIDIVTEILEIFEKRKRQFFKKSDLKHQYIDASGRDGVKRKYNLTSLSVAGYYGNLSELNNITLLIDKVTQYKKIVKSKKISRYYIVEQMGGKETIHTAVCLGTENQDTTVCELMH
jgi:diguanylate cyclase (GGDEF)-like protein